jgi:hypothetical protein
MGPTSESQPAPAPVACRLSPDEMASRRQLWEEVADVALVDRRPTPRGALLGFRTLPGVEERLRQCEVWPASSQVWIR